MSNNNTTMYFSIDIETDGPIPFDYSMLSFGVVAFEADGTVRGTYEANLDRIPGAQQHPDTMKNFWEKNPEAWEYCTSNTRPAKEVMPEFDAWVRDLTVDRRRSAICYPSGFDFTFLFPYLMRYSGSSPFMFSCIDVRSYVSGMRNCEYSKAGKSYWPKRWKNKSLKHTHKAIDDAVEQGLSFLKIRTENVSGVQDIDAVESKYLETLKSFRNE